MFFTNFTKNCRRKRVCVLMYYIGKGYFLTGHSEKGINFKTSNTLFIFFCIQFNVPFKIISLISRGANR